MAGAFRILVTASLLLACDREEQQEQGSEPSAERETKSTLTGEPLQPLRAPDGLDERMVALGNDLFNDTRLSADGTLACASCHVIAEGGDDGRALSVGIGSQLGKVNAPTVLNSSENFVQFWDGRAKTLHEQVAFPVRDPREMGADWKKVVERVAADPDYALRFATLFDDGVTQKNMATAIAVFEETLVAVGSSFDRWLEGDEAALTPDEVAGYELFKSVGCVACHQGRNVGGNMFQRFGVIGDYFEDRGDIQESDYGRFNVTKKESDRFVFRVPSLRMVEHTAPYFHDGSAETLEDAVRVMIKYQLGRRLDDNEVDKIVAFLRTLDGGIPKHRAAEVQPLKAPQKGEAG